MSIVPVDELVTCDVMQCCTASPTDTHAHERDFSRSDMGVTGPSTARYKTGTYNTALLLQLTSIYCTVDQRVIAVGKLRRVVHVHYTFKL